MKIESAAVTAAERDVYANLLAGAGYGLHENIDDEAEVAEDFQAAL